MFGALTFGGAPFAGVVGAGARALAAAASITIATAPANLVTGSNLSAATGVAFTTSGRISVSGPLAGTTGFRFSTSVVFPVHIRAAAGFRFAASASLTGSPLETVADITIDGVSVRGRVRMSGLTIRDILNDAPNTCTLVIEGDGPAVGQSIRVTLHDGKVVLFAGAIQTVDQSYESLPEHIAWNVTAIDDTAKANAKRPFGTFADVSATTVAQTIAANFAPAFATTGIVAGLPNVSIVFDGSETFIACLARIANAIGGYCKIEDGGIFLFLVDTAAPPDPIDHTPKRFLNDPPIQANVDASQLRTRVYGKGYGENVRADLAVGETLIPIQDGVNFPPLGGNAIVALTADGAQSDRVSFTSVEIPTGGSLVGPGAAPTTAPSVAVAAGSGVDTGPHTVSIVHVTANGKTLAGPAAAITVGTHPPPGTAPTAGAPLNGTGPDTGSHDYAASYVTSYGETVPSPISNAIAVSAATGQVQAPNIAPSATPTPLIAGNLNSTVLQAYYLSFVNALGETDQAGSANSGFIAPPQLPGTPNNGFPGGALPQTGGGLTPNVYYAYYFTFVTASGYETALSPNYIVNMGTNTAVQFQYLALHPDPRCTKRRIYRGPANSNMPIGGRPSGYLVVEISGNTDPNVFYTDTMSDATLVGRESVTDMQLPRGPDPGFQMHVSNIITGPAGVTARKLYRVPYGSGAPPRLVTTIPNNTATTYLDNVADASLNIDMPTSNTTGTAVQKIPVSNIPIGPASVTARNLYRRFNGAGPFKLVTTINNNSGTTYTDTTPNSGLGAAALSVATAIGNQIAVFVEKGVAAVTAREIYMSPIAGPPRRRVGVVNDNTTTAFQITTSDAALAGGPLEPVADTSGLAQPQGQVNPGATVLPVASAATFRVGGGWVVLGGGQVIRHTGISGQTLTGIPATGPGAITTTVLYGSQALPAPMLIGVSGIVHPILKGSAIHIWVQRDDLLAQAEQRARAGGDGVIEYLITDQRRGVDSLIARCDADLAMFSRPIVTVAYATRDMKTRSGKTVDIDLVSPRIAATLMIQDVTITEIDIAPHLPPRFSVKASSVRFSLEDTLRQMIATGILGL